tara:strand:- start:69 stop:449 length:381 start_codon:yes stop_codon:yes gene_type:complete
MGENLTYKIKEHSSDKEEVDIDSLMEEVEKKHKVFTRNDDYIIPDTLVALELDYSTNYTIKQLGQILDYYGISKRKLKKDEQIQAIILYETDNDNIYNVENRRRLWENIEELKNDQYFSKFILFNP